MGSLESVAAAATGLLAAEDLGKTVCGEKLSS
jgi:hypothetical protein